MTIFIIGVILFLIIFLSIKYLGVVLVYQDEFWWDTWNGGIKCTEVYVYKYVHFNKYFIKSDYGYRRPEDHPKYKRLLTKIEQWKIEKNPNFNIKTK